MRIARVFAVLMSADIPVAALFLFLNVNISAKEVMFVTALVS